MKSESRYLLFFFSLLLLVIIAKFIKEYSDIQNTYEQVAAHEARSLNHMVQAFSHSYSNLIKRTELPLDKQNIQFRPVMRLPEVSDIFSKISDTNIRLRTVSVEPMNPDNKATEEEIELIDFYINNPLEKEKLVRSSNDQFIYTKVLKAEKKCLTCHGDKAKAPKVVQSSYDKGYGFKVNDVLGLRVIYYKNSTILGNLMNTYYRSVMAATLVFSVIFISIIWLTRFNSKRDIEHLEELELRNKNLVNEQRRLSTLLNAMDIGIVFENAYGLVRYLNSAFSDIWQLSPKSNTQRESLKDIQKDTNVRVINEVDLSFSNNDKQVSELYLDNQKILLKSEINIKDDQDENFGRLTLFEDVTAKHQAQNKLTQLAENDALTGLYNRHKFQLELLEMELLIKRNKELLVLFFFDLDEFKVINDNYGHEQGDSVLRNIAQSVNAIIRPMDTFCRLGGDEFAILACMNNESEIVTFAQRIVSSVAKVTINTGDGHLRITGSVGCAYCDSEMNGCSELLAQADIAMYEAKAKGKNTYSLYTETSSNNAISVERLSWNEKIEKAFENDLFELHFQGVFNIQTSELSHLEVLIRMQDEDSNGGLISPGVFIPFAEKTGKILDIDRWVIKQSCKLLGQNPTMPSLAVNISGRSFDSPELPQYIGEQLVQNNVPAERLLIELTETEAVSDLMDAHAFIESLHEIGCPVCLDDFGSGFSSFAYLKHLTVEILKIDGLFINHLHESYDDQLFVESMIHVAKGMKKKSVAEFVENQETLEVLRHLGVDMAQGYYLDKPKKDHPALKG